MNVYQKLSAARGKFHQLELKKSGHNKFAGYYYFELSDFVVPALHLMREIGITPIISFGKDLAEMRLVNDDKPEEFIVITSPMSEAALKGCHPVQNLGAVESYIRRYLWVAALEIVEHDAVDASDLNDKPKATVIPALPKIELDSSVTKELANIAKNIGINISENMSLAFYEYAGITQEDHKIALWGMLDSKTRKALKDFSKTPEGEQIMLDIKKEME